MPITYEPIATTTVSGFASTINFSSIPSTYTDLRLVFNMKMITTNSSMFLRVNGDSGANYYGNIMSGDGFSASVSTSTSNTQVFVGPSRNAHFQLFTVDIFSYAGSTFKSFLSSSSVSLNGTGIINRGVSMWANTSAINSVSIFPNAANEIAGGSMATLYGIKAA